MLRPLKNLFILLLLAPMWAMAQQYDFRTYRPKDGLIHSEVNQVIQDSQGYLWIATKGGVSRFDGIEFQNFSNEEGLQSGEVVALAEGNDGTIWVSVLGKGVDLISNGKVSHLQAKLPSTEVQAFLNTDDGMWLGTFQGACLVQQDTVTTVLTSEDGLSANNIHSIFSDSDGHLWFGSFGGGVSKMHEEGFTYYNTSNGLVNNYITQIIEDAKGNIVISTLGGISIFKGDQFINITRNQGLINSQTNGMSVDSKGRIWLASFDGLTLLDRSGPILMSTDNGLPHNEVLSVMHDSQGNAWMGTRNGLSRLADLQFQYLEVRADSDLEIEPSSFLNTDTSVWIANTVGGVYTFDNQGFGPVHNDPDLLDHPISCMARTPDGSVWLGTSDFSGLMSIYQGKVSIYADEFGLASNNINCLAVDKNGVLIIGTPSGLSVYDGDFSMVMLDANPDESNVTSVQITPDGEWIVGMFNGMIYRGNSHNLKRIEPSFTQLAINDIAIYKDELIVATEGDGLFFITDSVRNFTQINGLASNYVRGLKVVNEQLVVSTSKGVNILDSSENWTVTASHIRGSGLRWTDCQAGALLVNKSKVWIGTSTGALVMDLSEAHSHTQPPLLQIGDLQLFYKNVNWSERNKEIEPNTGLPIALNLSYADNYLRFNFVGMDYGNPEGVTYQWKLNGFESDWNPPSHLTQANYPNLPPGDYTFVLKACSFDGICTEKEFEYSFSINPPFWKTTWFYIVISLAAILSIYLYILRRERVLKQEKEVLESTVLERTKELREQKEIVEAQHEHITEGIEYAKNIQMAILPSKEELKQTFANYFVMYQPKETVGGDFYWTYRKGNMVWAAAVDCTGHGVAGAFMSMIGSDLLNQVIIEKQISNPASILEEMDKGILLAFAQSAVEFESDQGMDMALIRIDLSNNEVVYAGAQRPLYVVSDGILKEYDGAKRGISSRKGERKREFTNHDLPLQKGDMLYMTSDGFADQFGGPKGKKFMTRRLKETLLQNYELTMNNQGKGLKKAFDDWIGAKESQIDDIVVFGIQL